MDRRFLTVLGVSLVFALVVSSVFYQMTARSSSAKRVEATDRKTWWWRPGHWASAG